MTGAMREAFEAWGKKKHGWVQQALDALWDVDMYRNEAFQSRWQAWQACAAVSETVDEEKLVEIMVEAAWGADSKKKALHFSIMEDALHAILPVLVAEHPNTICKGGGSE